MCLRAYILAPIIVLSVESRELEVKEQVVTSLCALRRMKMLSLVITSEVEHFPSSHPRGLEKKIVVLGREKKYQHGEPLRRFFQLKKILFFFFRI